MAKGHSNVKERCPMLMALCMVVLGLLGAAGMVAYVMLTY